MRFPLSPLPPPAAPRRRLWLLAVLLLGFGAFLRFHPQPGFKGVGFDEALYREYALKLESFGIGAYPEICEVYVEDQRKPDSIAKLPPTRFLYVFSGWCWKKIRFGDAPPANPKAADFPRTDPILRSLHEVSGGFTVLLLALTGIWVWRAAGPHWALGILALMACAPVQIHMGQHALIDGVFAFWATLCLWALWENLQAPNRPGRLFTYGAALAALVLVKENAFFVCAGIAALLGVNRWARFGAVTPRLLLISCLGPCAGWVVLVWLAGGLPAFFEIYTLLVHKAQHLPYAIKTGDGPWHRYLLDALLVSPWIVCLAIGGVFSGLKQNRWLLYLAVFVAVTYALMCNVRHGMNLRYATIWEFPTRALALAQIVELSRRSAQRHLLWAAAAVALLCVYDLRQYRVFFQDFPLYELAPEGLLRAVKILK